MTSPSLPGKEGLFHGDPGVFEAAIGSAVGLGNIWSFPFKMGKNGGFAFLIVYLLLTALVGVVIMLGELALGRKTGKGPMGAYLAMSKKCGWLGAMTVFSAYLIMSFYCVLGGSVRHDHRRRADASGRTDHERAHRLEMEDPVRQRRMREFRRGFPLPELSELLLPLRGTGSHDHRTVRTAG